MATEKEAAEKLMRAFHSGQCSGQAMVLTYLVSIGYRFQRPHVVESINERELSSDEEIARFHKLVQEIKNLTSEKFEERLAEALSELG